MLTMKRLNQYILADIFSHAWAGDSVSDVYQSGSQSNRHYHTFNLEKQAGLNHSISTVRQVWIAIP
jgi:hypothetical protein